MVEGNVKNTQSRDTRTDAEEVLLGLLREGLAREVAGYLREGGA